MSGVFGDCGDDGGAADAGGFEFGYLLESDAAEGEHRDGQAGGIYDVAQPARADGRAGKRVRRGREYRRISNEVRAVSLSGYGFGGVVGGVADDGARAEDAASVGYRNVVASEVDSGGACGERDVGPVVQQ